MKSGVQQVFLLLLYLILLAVVSRLLDLVLWHLQGLSPTQVVDPRLVLGVRQLKALLDARGVGYAGCVEKHELAELVENSGAVVQSELAALDHTEPVVKAKMAAPASHFSGGAHFYEEVEDTKDSVWLVQVAPEGSEPPLDDYSWRLVCAHLAPFAIRVGVFDCKLDRRLCAGKGWHEPLLLLALPRGTRAKDKVLMQIFHSTRPQAIVSWVRQQLSERVEKLANSSAANSWLSEHDNSDPGVRVLLSSPLSRPPLFLAALSVKFAGRIKFGLLHTNDTSSPKYLVSTPQGQYRYSSGKEEHFDFKSMLAFLRTVQPEANDALLLSLLVCQLLAVFKAATQRSYLAMAFTFFLHNLALLATWLALISLARVPALATPLGDLSVSTARWLALSGPGLWLRADIQLLSRHPYILLIVSVTFLYVVRKLLLEPPGVHQPALRLDLLARLVPTNVPLQVADEPPGPDELLVQRLAVPGLWLTPLVCSDYLSSLARWRHRGGVDIKRDKMSRALIQEISSRGKDSEFSDEEGPPSHALKALECPICLETYSRGSLLCALPCGHTFHEACVMAWLLRDHHSCPSCRWPAYKRKKQH